MRTTGNEENGGVLSGPELLSANPVRTNIQAIHEGWDLFTRFNVSHYAHYSTVICRLDCPSEHEWELEMADGEHLPDEPVFADDEKALEFVIHHAKLGSDYHIESLLLHCSPPRFYEEPSPIQQMWLEMEDNHIRDEALSDAATDLRDALSELLERVLAVEDGGHGSDEFWVDGNVTSAAIENAKLALEKASGK